MLLYRTKRKDGYQSKPVGEQGRETMETLFVTEIRNKKARRILPRTLIASSEQSLQGFWNPLGTGKLEAKVCKNLQKISTRKTATRRQERDHR